MDWLAFEPLTDVSSMTCMVEGHLGGHGIRDDLPLESVSLFCRALREFMAHEAPDPVLRGAYDFQLSFTRRTYSLWAQFYIAKFLLQDDGVHGRLALSGGFTVLPDAFTSFTAQFLEHFEPQLTGKA